MKRLLVLAACLTLRATNAVSAAHERRVREASSEAAEAAAARRV